MQSLLRDLHFAARILVRERLFTLVAVSMLALGIGANTAIFSVVNAVLLRSLPYRDADRLVNLHALEANGRTGIFSLTELEAFESMQSLEGMAAAGTQSVNLTGGERPARVRGAFVSANFFEVFGVQPVVGRSFITGEDSTGAAPVAIVSERLWHERLNSDASLASSSLTLNGEPHRIIGVVSGRFEQPFDPETVDVWLPASSFPDGRDVRYFTGLGYLAEGRTLAESRAEAGTIASQLAARDPIASVGRTATVALVRELVTSRSRLLLGSLLAAVAVILLITCANLAHLLLARGLARRREFSIRAALGASRWQLVRQLLTEATLLGLAGGGLGLVVAQLGLAALLDIPQSFVPVDEVALDGRVLLFTLGLSLLTAWLFGLLPALQLSKLELWSFMREGGRASGDSPSWRRVRSAFVIAQVALSLLLLVGTALLFRSFDELLRVDVGFEPRGLLTLEYRLPRNKYPEAERRADMHRRIAEEVRAVPGVESVALVGGLPFSGNGFNVAVTFPDRPPSPPGKEAKVLWEPASADYFTTLGIPFIQGERFDDREQRDAPAVIIVNTTMARMFWPGQSAIGKHVTTVADGTTATVVGVVGDTRHWKLEEAPPPQAYFPFFQQPDWFATVAIRTRFEPLALVEPVRQAIWRADAEQPMWKIRTLDSLVERGLVDRRFLITLVSIFACVALLLTWIGLYGVIRYLVDRRTPEIGIRMALGARGEDVVRLLSRQGMKLVAIGVGLGLAAAWIMTRFIASLLYGVSATDAPTFLLVAASLLPITWLACYLPARRATRIEPMLALRHE
jgi:putative ABC transport system permease protein